MAKAGGDDEGMIVDINVTPLVDVVLVLLIIFMVTARLSIPPTVPLELPKASTGEQSTKFAPLAISLAYAPPKQPTPLYLNGTLISYDDLKKKVAAEVKRQKKDLQVIIAADRRVMHGKVMSLLDLLRRLGVEQYAFNIDADNPPQP
ncbi:MAG: biopolymer transporter ExbD [Deltaproteobacteria bacterium]|nr:MAG: biopolymer transporter ExbD [Deltaproteobacteria bacterium]